MEEHWLANRLLAVRRFDEGGEPAVMLHGLGGTSLNWTDLAFQMAGRLDSWAIDLPGFGATPPPRDGDYSPQGYARGVVELIDEHIEESVHLFGNSMGGAIALQVAARYPDRVRSLTLISPALPGNRVRSANFHLPVLAVPGVGERLTARYMKQAPVTRVRDTLRTCYADTDRIHPQRLAEAIAEVERRDRLTYSSDAWVQALRGLLKNMVETGPERPLALARRITAPTLLIYGQKDKLVDPRGAHRVGNLIPDSRVVMLPDSGHVAQMEHPEYVKHYWEELIGPPWRP